MSPFNDRQFVVRSALDPDECQRRVRRAIDGRFNPFGTSDIYGSSSDGSIQIFRRRFMSRPVVSLEAMVRRGGSGTILDCRAGAAFNRKMGLGCLTTVGLLIFAVMLASWLGDEFEPGVDPVIILGPLGIVAAGWLLDWFTSIGGHHEADDLTDFLVSKVEGTIEE